jgi:2-iminobutanoate/2-iminopropanoate deaminase
VRQPIETEEAPRPIGAYTQAIRVGEWIWVSGQIGLGSDGRLVAGGVEAETRQALAHLKAILAKAGSGLDRVVKVTLYLADLRDFDRVNTIYGDVFTSKPAPARACVQVAALPRGARVELDAVAVVS